MRPGSGSSRRSILVHMHICKGGHLCSLPSTPTGAYLEECLPFLLPICIPGSWLDRWSYAGSLHSHCNSVEVGLRQGTQGYRSSSSSSVLPPLKIQAGVPSASTTAAWKRLSSVSHVTPQFCAAIAHFLQVDLHT